MIPLQYTAITTPLDVWRAVMESFGRNDFEEPGNQFYDAAVDAIHDATATIEAFLNRGVIVRAKVQRLKATKWKRDERFEPHVDDDLGCAYRAFADAPPALQVLEVDGATSGFVMEVFPFDVDVSHLLVIRENHYLTGLPRVVKYYGGFRRVDQDVSASGSQPATCGSGSGERPCLDLNDEEGLADLLELPPPVPGDIERCCKRLVIFELRVQIQGMMGYDRSTKQVEGITIEHTRPRHLFQKEELEKIRFWKKPISR